MHKNDQSRNVALVPQSIHEIERFTDDVCDNLYINDTYYGNILMSLTTMFELCLTTSEEKSVNISYNTDYQVVTIVFKPLPSQLSSLFSEKIVLSDDELSTKAFLIKNLTDKVKLSDQSISLQFDIRAMHNKVYRERMDKLQSYLSQHELKKVKRKND